MKPKPSHLSEEYARQFCDTTVVAAYYAREPYPVATAGLIAKLTQASNPRILELGCGTGDLTKHLTSFSTEIDAVDFSQEMLAVAQVKYSGAINQPNWHCIRAEEFRSLFTYDLICAGASLHWMNWEVLFPRLEAMIDPVAPIVLVDRSICSCKWDSAVLDLIMQYSTNRDFHPYDLVTEIELRGFFRQIGSETTEPIPFTQSVDDYIESFHSRNGFSRERMPSTDAAVFDNGIRNILLSHCPDGLIRAYVSATVTWGHIPPQANKAMQTDAFGAADL